MPHGDDVNLVSKGLENKDLVEDEGFGYPGGPFKTMQRVAVGLFFVIFIFIRSWGKLNRIGIFLTLTPML
jgi:hypothetical protein